MDIGTGKDLSDYIVDGCPVPVHLVDIVDAGYRYNVYEYQRDFIRVYNDMRQRSLVPVVCGGLGSLHAVALTSFCESEMQSVAALGR